MREAQQFKENLKAVFAINRKVANTAIGRDVAKALGMFEDVPVVKAALAQRVIYAESAGQGLSVVEAAPGSDAAREIIALADALTSTSVKRAAA